MNLSFSSSVLALAVSTTANSIVVASKISHDDEDKEKDVDVDLSTHYETSVVAALPSLTQELKPVAIADADVGLLRMSDEDKSIPKLRGATELQLQFLAEEKKVGIGQACSANLRCAQGVCRTYKENGYSYTQCTLDANKGTPGYSNGGKPEGKRLLNSVLSCPHNILAYYSFSHQLSHFRPRTGTISTRLHEKQSVWLY